MSIDESTSDTGRPQVVLRWKAMGGMVEKEVAVEEIESVSWNVQGGSENPLEVRFGEGCMPQHCCSVDYPAEKRYVGTDIENRSLPTVTDGGQSVEDDDRVVFVHSYDGMPDELDVLVGDTGFIVTVSGIVPYEGRVLVQFDENKTGRAGGERHWIPEWCLEPVTDQEDDR